MLANDNDVAGLKSAPGVRGPGAPATAPGERDAPATSHVR